MNPRSKLFLLSVLLVIAGCSATIDEYQGTEPKLQLEQFFSGQLEAYGIVQDRSGKVLRRFRADIVGKWEENRGVLDENFVFADGEMQHRCWRLAKEGSHYSGVAADVLGKATGEVKGHALNWRYTLQVPIGEKVWDIQLNDWMYLVDEENLINRASMSKFGIDVGEITLFIRKTGDVAMRDLTQGCGI
ncbi:DUF3833 domain-containing protein [Neptuniibacter caesariensis]|uniref:Uncharacterized conserved secreted protein n=1 Tax=Neptuniibacter caesariensis TaxID=207954 RepID=A0A7U8GRV3_NEPCE|nr:DUF3833 domain-containing protein [Neptuniibacter caesariensis]EAR60731.1 Uncharacterized conserved secreted protein [Neptuniibacter caesariensis]